MIKYLNDVKGNERLGVTIDRSKTINVSVYGGNDFNCVIGAYEFDVKREDKAKFKNCETFEAWEELKEEYAQNIRKVNY